MKELTRPVVMVHGLWDSPEIFNPLVNKLDQPPSKIFLPFLPHKLGKVPIRNLAFELHQQISIQFASDVSIDLLGFSMGGLISRVWMHEFGGSTRTKRFFSIGSPQQGTLTAQLVPSSVLAGIADMKLGSELIRSFEKHKPLSRTVECISFFCFSDLMVFPGWRAVLPYGRHKSVPVISHKSLISHKISLDLLADELLTVD
nr:alpha/beta hydrolase [Prochlorococcus marinus]